MQKSFSIDEMQKDWRKMIFFFPFGDRKWKCVSFSRSQYFTLKWFQIFKLYWFNFLEWVQFNLYLYEPTDMWNKKTNIHMNKFRTQTYNLLHLILLLYETDGYMAQNLDNQTKSYDCVELYFKIFKMFQHNNAHWKPLIWIQFYDTF